MSRIKRYADRFAAATLCVGLEPGRFSCAVRQGGSWRADSAYTQRVDGGGHWRGALDALQLYLRQPERGARGLPLTVALAGRWSRMLTLPWSDVMLTDAGTSGFLHTQFSALYGEAAAGWELRADNAAYGQPRLACAVERELLLALHGVCAEQQQACRSIEPVLAPAWRGIAASAAARPRAFAVIEADQLTLGHAVGGSVVASHMQRWDGDWGAELGRALQRWLLRAPELAAVQTVTVLDLSGEPGPAVLPAPFQRASAPDTGLGAQFAFLACGTGPA